MNERNTRDWALAYANLGWRVFPVVAGEKRPLYRGWQGDATTDPELIARYWRREPGPNIGIVTGESFVAFDIEAAHLAAFGDWLATNAYRLPDTPIAATGRGGIHVLVRAREPQCGRILRLGDTHVGELKARGGFIVACPSRTSGPYGWRRSPLEVELAEAPEWLLELVSQPDRQPTGETDPAELSPSRAVALVAGLYRMVATAPEGERNDLLFWASCRIAEHHVDTIAATEILLAAARQAGLSEQEARSTIRSGLAR